MKFKVGLKVQCKCSYCIKNKTKHIGKIVRLSKNRNLYFVQFHSGKLTLAVPEKDLELINDHQHPNTNVFQ